MKQRDLKHLYDHIILNEGAYFFKKGSLVIDSRYIDSLFNDVLKDVAYKIQTVIKRKNESGNLNYASNAYCSLLIFTYETIPKCLDLSDMLIKDLYEKKLAYLLIVEINDYVVIIKKNISHLSAFINRLEPIGGKTLSGSLVSDKTSYQQVKLTNMNTNDNAMRNKSFEANDLKTSLSMFSANHNIVTSARFSEEDNICTLNISTSRIARFGKKKSIPSVVGWIDGLIQKMDTYVPIDNFLNRFAIPLTWKNLQTKPTPSALLINCHLLLDYINELDNTSIYKKYKGGYKDITEMFKKFISFYSKCSNVEYSDGKHICTGIYQGIIIKSNKQGLNLSAKNALSKLAVYDKNGRPVKLINLINKIGCYTVSFTDCSYIYYSRRIYKNTQISTDLESILSIFEPVPSMVSVTSEKGTPIESSVNFDDDCVFHIVENDIFNDADYLMCDDMGNEWADHIAIKGNTLSFIHSKCIGEIGLSASKFQDVIGQAVKNIGNLTPDDESLDKKLITLQTTVKKTMIPRCRIGNAEGFIERFKELKFNPNRTKEVCLAINFISKDQLSDAFEKIKENESFVQKNSVVQMIWMLNGFIGICKDADLHCRIFCNP